MKQHKSMLRPTH